MTACEANFDGLVGPTHNYAGLSPGNLASQVNLGQVSSPREAALQGLRKMRLLHGLGLVQGVLPPQERPAVDVLRRLGFEGTDVRVLAAAARHAPRLLVACSSASSMWAANAATVSPSADTADGRVHFTPANLVDRFHRSIEPPTTARVLRAIFADDTRFVHHGPLPSVRLFGDEGAANHTRLCTDHGRPGVELFVHGRAGFGGGARPGRHPARQSREASEAVARLHRLDPGRTVIAQQNPAAIDQGVFHNDVIAVGHRDVFLYHEEAFLARGGVRDALERAFAPGRLRLIEVPAQRVSVAEAVRTYLFNSQLITLPQGEVVLVVPQECRESDRVDDYLRELMEGDTPIRRIEVCDLRQSMRNGGGPACLRLRVVLTRSELAAVGRGVLLDDPLYERLCEWVRRHYRDRLSGADLADPALLEECRVALDELTRMLGLGAIYPFQLAGA